MLDKVKAIGRVRLLARGADGRVVLDREEENLVVATGLNFIAQRMIGATPAVMSHMAVGTSSTAPSAGQTALSGELARVSMAAPSVLAGVVSYSANFPPGTGTGALQEAGIFNAGVAGTMLNRLTFSLYNKAAGDDLWLYWSVTIQ
jgi:hypothetical protein